LLHCDRNELTSLNVSECSGLQVLFCGMNSLTTIDISNNTDLWHLDCQVNQLTALDFSKNIDLEVLVCEENMISSLDLSEHVELTTLVCGKNLIEHLDLSNNILLGTGFAWKENQLDLQHMPSLHEVCVWTPDFPPVGLNIDTTGSPNVCFETDCDGECSNVGFEVSRHSEISVYPNPTGGLLFIETGNPELYSIDVSSMNGQLIFKGEMEGTTHQIDLSAFQAGIYFITIRSKDFVTTRKVIKLGNF